MQYYEMIILKYRYADQERDRKAAHLAAHPYARWNQWHETTGLEVLRFFACIFHMGILQHSSLANYWSTDPVLAVSLIPTIFTKNRLVKVPLQYFSLLG